MATKRTSITIVDKKESLPLRVNHATRKWEIFDPATNTYKDTGIMAVPEDDSTAMKYYKLTNTPQPPAAPGDSATSWPDVASLNAAVITQAGWSADPLPVTLQNRFCWAAYYRLENVKDNTTGVYSQRYKLNLVGLYNNYAASPVITISETGVVTITNPDGTTQTVNLMTADSYTALMTMVSALQSQVDSAVYSYSGVGAPTKDHSKAPLNSWGINPGSPSNVIADVYNTHVGDTYTNTDDYVSYRFILKPGHSASDPLSYEWQIIADGALSAALQEIAKLGNTAVKIFTAQPAPTYKKGDMWIDTTATPTVIRTCIIPKDANGAFAATDWIVPFATKEEMAAVQQGLQNAQNALNTAQQNINDLQGAIDNLEDVALPAMQDSIISENERKDLKRFSDQLDVEQEQLISNVTYLKTSPYLPADKKATLENAANKLLTANTGTLDVLQARIADIINPSGDQGATITTVERNAYNEALTVYKADHKALSVAIDSARAAVDDALKKAVDDVRLGTVNLLGRNDYSALEGTQTIITEYPEFFDAVSSYKTSTPGVFFNVGTVDAGEYVFSIKMSRNNVSEYFTLVQEDGVDVGQYTNFDVPAGWYRRDIKVTVSKKCNLKILLYWNARPDFPTGFLWEWAMLVQGNKAPASFVTADKDVLAEMNALITGVDVEYGLSNSPTVQPETWTTTAPAWQADMYMWQRQKITKKDGTVEYSNANCIQGAEGKGIKSIVEQYYQSTSATALVSGSWVNTAPTPVPDKYIWTRSEITYTDDSVTTTDAVRTPGDKGTDALNVSVIIQGHFRNYWERQVNAQGVESYLLKKEVVGGVMVNGTEYVQATALIRKGVVDVTDSAISKGAALKWYINGVEVFGNVKTINLGIEYADGTDDQIFLDYDDANAINW